VARRVSVTIGASHRVTVDTWPEAVRAACDPLIALGAAEARYADACVRMVEEHGPYIVIAPGLALVHARPEEGGLALAVAATLLEDAVVSGHSDNDPVDLLLAFTAPDARIHVAMLSRLATALIGGLADDLRTAASAYELRGHLTAAVDEATSIESSTP